MKHYLIKSINCIVSDAEPTYGEYGYGASGIVLCTTRLDFINNKKVLFSNNNSEGLKPFEIVDEVEELAFKTLCEENILSEQNSKTYDTSFDIKIWKSGYKAKASALTEEDAIGFLEWVAKNNWYQTKTERGLCWCYNGKLASEEKPTSKELLALYLTEQDSKLIEVEMIKENIFKIKKP